ncbi:MAG: PEP-CTERM sorting domain-containing protein [Phycisphaerae bacterium]|nr:PEP-CTERM sorting domain-containing protein [Phycisphaerae bacterium]
MKNLYALGMILVVCTAGSATMTVDGNLNDWDAQSIFQDPDSDNPGGVEMTRWGAKVQDGQLYWFCEINRGWTDFLGQASNGKDKKIFPGLWIDADNSTDTYLADGGDANCADGDKGEWSSNHRGIDVNLELGLIGGWTNGENSGPDGEGEETAPGLYSQFNYWGAGDDVGDIADMVTDGAWCISGNVMEARISLSELDAILQEMSDGVSIGDTMKLAVGVQGTNRAEVSYGYDTGAPQVIAVPAGIPEPATLSLLAISALAMGTRRRDI